MINKETIEEVKNRLVKTYNPIAIYLFGSYAWGSPTEDSDLDLLVIIEHLSVLCNAAHPIGLFYYFSSIISPYFILIIFIILPHQTPHKQRGTLGWASYNPPRIAYANDLIKLSCRRARHLPERVIEQDFLK